MGTAAEAAGHGNVGNGVLGQFRLAQLTHDQLQTAVLDECTQAGVLSGKAVVDVALAAVEGGGDGFDR